MGGVELRGVLTEKENRGEEKERWLKIEKSKYNKWYSRIKERGVPEYLKKEWKEEWWQRMARYRLGEKMRGNK